MQFVTLIRIFIVFALFAIPARTVWVNVSKWDGVVVADWGFIWVRLGVVLGLAVSVSYYGIDSLNHYYLLSLLVFCLVSTPS